MGGLQKQGQRGGSVIPIMNPNDGKNWARLIINRMEFGRKYCNYSQRSARDVLGLPDPAPEPAQRLRFDQDGRVQRTTPNPEFA